MSTRFSDRLQILENEIQRYRLIQCEQERWKRIIENWVLHNFGFDIQTEVRKFGNDQKRFIQEQPPAACPIDANNSPKKISNGITDSVQPYNNLQIESSGIRTCSKDDTPMSLDFVATSNETQNNSNFSLKIIGYSGGENSVQKRNGPRNVTAMTVQTESQIMQQTPLAITPAPENQLDLTGNGKTKAGPAKKYSRKKPQRLQLAKGSGRGSHMKSASRKFLPRRKLKNLSIDEKYEVLQRLCQPGVNQSTVCEERQLNKSVVSRIWCDRFKIEELYREGRGKHKKVKKQKDGMEEGLPTLVPLPTMTPSVKPNLEREMTLGSTSISSTLSTPYHLQQQFHTIARFSEYSDSGAQRIGQATWGT